jgi:hypothetical protein
MIYNQLNEPRNASIGDAWTDGKSFKRVLSRGRSWENVNIGATHPDEVDHDQQERERAEAKQRDESAGDVGSAVGADPVSQGNGDDGQVSGSPVGSGQAESAKVADESEGEATPAPVPKQPD